MASSEARFGQRVEVTTTTLNTPEKQRWTISEYVTDADGVVVIDDALAAKHQVRLGEGRASLNVENLAGDACEIATCLLIGIRTDGFATARWDLASTGPIRLTFERDP